MPLCNLALGHSCPIKTEHLDPSVVANCTIQVGDRRQGDRGKLQVLRQGQDLTCGNSAALILLNEDFVLTEDLTNFDVFSGAGAIYQAFCLSLMANQTIPLL